MQNSEFLAKINANDPYRLGEVSGHNCGDKPADTSGCCAFNTPGGSCPREGCFRVKGSQFIYGHNSMYAPMVPWMLTGETFDATHLALAKTNYYPKMLHSWLDWTDVDREKNVVTDFRKIAKIRTDNQDIFHNNIYETKLINVPCASNPSSQVVPYARYIGGKKACVVIGNDSTVDDVTFALRVPLAQMGMGSMRELYVTDCWANTTTKVATSALNSYSILVPKDKSPGGGVRVLIISPSMPSTT
jgi:hypothetical protein